MPAGMLLFFAMFLGGSTGSTSGGIKMARHLVVLKNIRVIFRKMISTNAIIPLKLNGARIDSEFNSMITGFVISYLMLLILGSIVLVFLGMDLMTASSAVATCMAGIGPGFGSIGPMSNFAHLTPAAKIVLSGTMLAGRLEIYSLLVLFTPAFWKV
jgi:trk system potassium uptake protein TrkH